MKAERRHELRESDLVRILEAGRDYLERHGKGVAIGVVIVVVAVTAVTVAVRSRAATMEDVWRRRAALTFESVEDGKQSLKLLTQLAQQAADRQFLFSTLIEQGAQALRLAEKAPAPPDPELNDLAADAYNRLLSEFSDNPLAVGIARCGLATAAENRFALDGESSHRAEAEKQLSSVLNDASLNALPFQRIAADRLKRLNDVFTRVTFVYPEAEETSPAPSPPSVAPVDIDEEFSPMDDAVSGLPPQTDGPDEAEGGVEPPSTSVP